MFVTATVLEQCNTVTLHLNNVTLSHIMIIYCYMPHQEYRKESYLFQQQGLWEDELHSWHGAAVSSPNIHEYLLKRLPMLVSLQVVGTLTSCARGMPTACGQPVASPAQPSQLDALKAK